MHFPKSGRIMDPFFTRKKKKITKKKKINKKNKMKSLFRDICTKIFKVGQDKEIDKTVHEIIDSLTFDSKSVRSEEMKTLLMCLKSIKIRVPKYILFFIFEYYKETYLLSYHHILPICNGIIQKEIKTDYEIYSPYFGVYNNQKREFGFYNYGVKIKLK